jgi:hypothetical protein
VWADRAGITLSLPESVFADPRRPEWNGQVLAQTHGFVEGDEVGTLGLGTGRLGPLLATGMLGRSEYHLQVLSSDGRFPLGEVVHPAFLREAAGLGSHKRSYSELPGGSCTPPPAGVSLRTGVCENVEWEVEGRLVSVQILEVERGGSRWIRVKAGENAGAWVQLRGSDATLTRVSAYVRGKPGSGDRLVVQTRFKDYVTVQVLRIGFDLALEQGRLWQYPPAGSGLVAKP